MREDLAQCDGLQPTLVQLVEEARSDLDDGRSATAVLIAVHDQCGGVESDRNPYEKFSR
jgi:hypothetical protein